MLAEKAVIRARNKHKEIKLILVLPCKDQEKYWTENNKAAFAEIKNKADKIVYLSENYSKDCMHKRNRHLVNFSGYCVAYLNKNSGRTAYTLAKMDWRSSIFAAFPIENLSGLVIALF